MVGQLGDAGTRDRCGGRDSAGDGSGRRSRYGPPLVAWVVAGQAQGQGYGKEAARSLVLRLHESGWLVVAYIHPDHLASQHVARAAGLSPSSELRDGEVRWTSRPAMAPASVQAI